jgi:hypothetical protein
MLMGLIRMYWVVIPESFRRRCIFRESCSHRVYRETRAGGLEHGLGVLMRRWSQCRDGYIVCGSTDSGRPAVVLRDGSVCAVDDLRI